MFRQTALFALAFSLWLALVFTKPIQAQFTPPSTVTMQMRVLTSTGADRGFDCQANGSETRYGCTFFDNEAGIGASYTGIPRPYPYTSNPVSVNIENDYLLDVVAQEMSPEVYNQSVATRAQAVAARSYLHWQIGNTSSTLNNTTQYQAFIPFRFEGLTLNSGINPNNTSNPCASTNLNPFQQAICAATSPRHYIAQDGFDLPAKALFFADTINSTNDGTFDRPYFVAVPEPISTVCDASNDTVFRIGLSQEGANRWARGNQCARPASGDQPWSVRWTRPEQVLFHYYTDVNLRNMSSGNAILDSSPPYRWNPLSINWNTTNNQPPAMLPNQSYLWSATLQNTGTTSWNCRAAGLLYVWYGWIDDAGGRISTAFASGSATGCGLAPGQTVQRTWSVSTAPVANWGCGDFRLKMDLLLETPAAGDVQFSAQGWSSYDVVIPFRYVGCARVYLPLVTR